MKKHALLILLPFIVMLSGCSYYPYSWSDQFGWGDYDNEYYVTNPETGQYMDREGRVRTYKKPRQYHVTTKDEEKYHAINERIMKRKNQIKNDYASPSIESSDSVSAQTNRAPSYNTEKN